MINYLGKMKRMRIFLIKYEIKIFGDVALKNGLLIFRLLIINIQEIYSIKS